MVGKGGRHHLERSLVGHAFARELLNALHIRHLDVHRLLDALRQSKCSFGCPATEPLGAALATALAKQRLSWGNNANPEQLSRMLRAHGICSCPTRFSFVLRLTMSHVVISCVGVKHISGASGESRVVSGPSPGYPHVWSKQAGQCLPGCALEQIQAIMHQEAMENLRNLPRL